MLGRLGGGVIGPYPGEGIGKAMETGEMAAAAITAGAHGDPDALTAYGADVEASLRPRYAGYAAAQRWLSRPWLNDLVSSRIRKGRFLHAAAAGMVAETVDPARIFSWRWPAALSGRLMRTVLAPLVAVRGPNAERPRYCRQPVGLDEQPLSRPGGRRMYGGRPGARPTPVAASSPRGTTRPWHTPTKPLSPNDLSFHRFHRFHTYERPNRVSDWGVSTSGLGHGRCRTRTCDIYDVNVALYQLS